MNPRIETLTEKKLIGKRITMSFSDDRTFQLWRSFMPRPKEIQNSVGSDLYCVQVYAAMDFNNVNPAAAFDKWAAIEVADFTAVPNGMETITLPAGLYAVFLHTGAEA